MYKIEIANINNVDLLLDMKLDIIFNSPEIMDLEKNDMEKIVNYAEEEIRENINEYKIILNNESIIGTYSVVNYNDGKLIDTIYLYPSYRNNGIGTKIFNKIINSNYQPLYLWVYKSNEKAINLYKKIGFEIEEETETRFFMKYENKKNENEIIKARLFCKEVEELSNKYNLEYFIVTEGTSLTKVKKCDAVRNARNNHIKWEKENGYDPNEDWSINEYDLFEENQ